MDLSSRLAALEPTIEHIMKIGGAVGLAIGVVHEGMTVYQANFGYRDLEDKLPVTQDTIFAGCSLEKAVTSATVGILVEEGHLDWNSLIKDVLPEFQVKDTILRNCTTMADLLSHRTGLSRVDNVVFGSDNNVLIPGKDGLKFLNSLHAELPFRGQFQYQNMGYEIAGLVINEVSGSLWSDLIKSRILKPLDMKRTTLRTPPSGTDNVSKAYNTLDDGSPTLIGSVKDGDDGFGGPSGGIRTCVNDLLKLYKVLLRSMNDQFATGRTSTDGSPLSQVNHIMSARIPMSQPTLRETSYASGWARVQLPGAMGAIGANPALMPGGMPLVGKHGPSTLVMYHQGSFPGALAAVNLVPNTESAIVVLSNSLTLNDTPDWIGQLILEELLETSEKNDYIKLAEASAAQTARWYPNTYNELYKGRTGTDSFESSRELSEYVGTYWDDIHVFKIEVTESEGDLYWLFQGLESERYILDHYEGDVFTWLRPRNDLAKRGRWVDQPAPFWKADFRPNHTGEISKLYWKHDTLAPALELSKTPKSSYDALTLRSPGTN